MKLKKESKANPFSLFLAIGALFVLPISVQGEAILQYFQTSWSEITRRMPELAEAGYTALWLPPPFKSGAGAWSVGFDPFDRFDYGSKDQMGTIPTKYGTATELRELMKMAHRFGLRVYFDNVMCHNGGPIPGYDEYTSIRVQPGFVPEDFHLQSREDGFYRKFDGGVNYDDEWQVLYRNPFGLDIAQENPNQSFGQNEGEHFPKYSGIRHPDNPEYYLDTDLPVATNYWGEAMYTFANKEPFDDVGYGTENAGAGNGRFDWDDVNGNGQHDAGETSEPFEDTGIDPSTFWRYTAQWGYGDGIYNMGNPCSEDVNSMLFRAVRWFVNECHVDGFRLDAVKHAPHYFFGQTWGDKDASGDGYCGQIQEQFNLTRGYSDWNNHRDTVFSTDAPRDDAMLFGEHLGHKDFWEYKQSDYLNAGMRIGDDQLHNGLQGVVSGWGNMSGSDQPNFGIMAPNLSVMYSGSHDVNYISGYDRPMAHTMLLTRDGLPIIYTDGYHHSGPPDYFPKWADNPFLGQFGDTHLLNLLYINQLFARGEQSPKWSDDSFAAYERMDWRETGDAGNAVVLSIMMARNGSGGQSRGYSTSFPEGARLKNYSPHGGSFYANVWDGQIKNDEGYNPVVPENGYFAFSWRIPELPALWNDRNDPRVQPIVILQDGEPAGTIMHTRKDGPDGDANFNPYGVEDDSPEDYSYQLEIPRVTNGTNLVFQSFADGSAIHIMMKLDGGIDLNSQMGIGPQEGDLRDNPPAIAWDMFLGYESMSRTYRIAEKFAAADVSRNIIGSPGSESYVCTIGTPGFTLNDGGGINMGDDYSVTWVYHNPENGTEWEDQQFVPAPENAADTSITVWVKVGYNGQPNRAFLYYTTDGETWPEGSGGRGKDNTQVVEMQFDRLGANDGNGDPDWWKATLPALPNGTELRYKVGVCKDDAPDQFPFSGDDHARIERMESLYSISNFNAETVSFYEHNDYGTTCVGLEEGYHILSSKAFINRGGAASIYNLNKQTFYYDTQTPLGQIQYPAADGDTLYGTYGVVVRGDRTVSEVWYRITDTDSENDDTATGMDNGNGAWVQAIEENVSSDQPGPLPRKWRFDYINVPSLGTADIEVRLLEVSSSHNMDLSDEEGHFTTLQRTVNTRGPDYQLFVQWPGTDGDTVGPDYVMKAPFTKAMADNISEADLINCFTIQIDSNLQERSEYSINYNTSSDHHELAFTLPNLYDRRPDYLHRILITFNRDGYPELTATRFVKAYPVVTPYISIITPPALDEDGKIFAIRLPDVASPAETQRQYLVQIETETNAQHVMLSSENDTAMLSAVPGNPVFTNSMSQWCFTWSFPLTNDAAQIEGTYRLFAELDNDGNTNTVEANASRSTRVVVREFVNISTNDADSDEDGIPDFNEQHTLGLPSSSISEWNNGDVHGWYIYGKTKADCPDCDGDGLPDGLECGWRAPLEGTATNIDTDADGFMNFISDLDPPFYNTCDNYNRVPDVSECDSGSKTELKGGSVTDPNNPDSDYDGLPDGLEDANRNGWVDGDGDPLPVTWDPWLDRDWPNGIIDSGETWLETSPCVADSDNDGLSDGYGEDKNADGLIAGDLNTNRIYDAGEAWTETDPLAVDTDNDGLPDGWETWNGLDPLDNGSDSLRTADAGDGTPVNGPEGDPDGDGFSNLSELISGSNPQRYDDGSAPPTGDITIGEGTPIIVGNVENKQEFTDWTYEDVIALDAYDILEGAENGGDVYFRPWASDGLESSRDLVAFYAHDGGSSSEGGDDKLYFRVDFNDLKANAEEHGLDIYVVIDTGNTSIGERKVLNDVDVLTDMRWEAVIVVDDWNNNVVYVNTPGSVDTDSLEDMVEFSDTDVQVRTASHAAGFGEVYFNSDLDACEFSIQRQALLDAGWNGDFGQLNFQVFTTRDDIGNDPVGSGDLEGPDIQDSIRTDWIAEDFAGETGDNIDEVRYNKRVKLTTLVQWVGINADNDRGKRIKILPIIHGSKPLLPGNLIQDMVNTGNGAGFYRPLEIHEAYAVPFSMHITPTLASAIQWAESDGDPAWKDGPTLNTHIARLAATNLLRLTGSTFADHMLPYFTTEFNQNNVQLAGDFLRTIYGPTALSDKVFWTPERLLDSDCFSKIQDMGYEYTFIDQSQHLNRWFGFGASVSVDAYRVNRINGIGCFVINDRYYGRRFQTLEGGPDMIMRRVFNHRMRTGQWDSQHPQIFTLQMDWDEFTDNSTADAYDTLIRWMSSRGWIEFVNADQVANHEVDISVPPDGCGDTWNEVNHGFRSDLTKTGHDWIQFSAQNNYDNWYIGDDLNQGLANYTFNIRSGVEMPENYGMLYSGGIVSSSWENVTGMNTETSELARLASATLHASIYKTGYHTQSQDPLNMQKFSVGDFVYPDSTWDELTEESRYSQSQTRMAVLYNCVDQWTINPPSVTTTESRDVDLDGEDEYLLYNERLFCIFERIGGRMIAAWSRTLAGDAVKQVAGNLLSYPGTETEEIATFNVNSSGEIGVYRMSCFVDWWATKGEGTAQYINDLYSFSAIANGWQMTSSDGDIVRQITLAPDAASLDVTYNLVNDMAGETLYIRHGLSPNLFDLLLYGQKALGGEMHENGLMTLVASNYCEATTCRIGYADENHSAGFTRDAVDDNPGSGYDFDTIPMRNLPQTHQVELVGTNTFSFSLGFYVGLADWDSDGIPNVVEDAYGFMQSDDPTDAALDSDGDGTSNYDEYIAGTLLNSGDSFPCINRAFPENNGIRLRFAAEAGRNHYIWYTDDNLTDPAWKLATTNPIRGDGSLVEWNDDGSQTTPTPDSDQTTKRYYRIQYEMRE